jgi:cytochrome c-type biogenesis protein CcmH/NrfF
VMWFIFFVSFLFAQESLPEQPLGEVLAKEEQVDVVYKIAKVLRCPTCQGVSVADSGADGAKAMKARIQELVAQGYTSDQVLDYFVSKYGEWILLRPKKEHQFLWLAPIFFLGIGVVLIVWRGSKNNTSEDENKIIEDVKGSQYRASILKELEED